MGCRLETAMDIRVSASISTATCSSSQFCPRSVAAVYTPVTTLISDPRAGPLLCLCPSLEQQADYCCLPQI